MSHCGQCSLEKKKWDTVIGKGGGKAAFNRINSRPSNAEQAALLEVRKGNC